MGRAGPPDPKPDIRFRKLINDAIAKDPNNPLAIFVDTNLPIERAYRFYTPAVHRSNASVPSHGRAAGSHPQRQPGVDPYNFLAFSNHPQHYSDDDTVAPGNHWAAIVSQKARVPIHHQQALMDLVNAVNLYGNVPTHFPQFPTRHRRIGLQPLVTRGTVFDEASRGAIHSRSPQRVLCRKHFAISGVIGTDSATIERRSNGSLVADLKAR
jgi:hypothetical protein